MLVNDGVGRENSKRTAEKPTPRAGGGALVDGVFLDESELDAREVELAELSAHLDAATHRQLTLIRIMDVSERWAKRGAKSCAHWLAWRVGLDPGAARERVRVARKLGELPAIDHALRRGALSYSKARAMTRVATPSNEARLLGIAEGTTAAHLEKVCRGVRQQQREDGRAAEDGAPERYVRLRHRGDGTVRFEAVLLPDEAERVMEALRSVRAAMSEGLEMKPDQADALARIADAVLAGDLSARDSSGTGVSGAVEREREGDDAEESRGSDTAIDEARDTMSAAPSRARTCGADRAQVVVHFTEDLIDGGHSSLRHSSLRHSSLRHSSLRHSVPSMEAVLDDGGRVSAETFRRLACDCSLLGVLEDGRGAPLDIGRKTRRIPPALRRAVMLRDRCCRFPGCTHDRYIDLHHLEHWLHGGETSKQNLLALCTAHHRLVHEGGFTLQTGEDGEPRFMAPDRHLIPFVPTPSAAPADPLSAFEHAHAELAIHEETGLTSWDGEPVDCRACVGAVCAADEEPDLHLPVGAWLAKHRPVVS
jgi:hypothetical protein